jgi:hypothetical protein
MSDVTNGKRTLPIIYVLSLCEEKYIRNVHENTQILGWAGLRDRYHPNRGDFICITCGHVSFKFGRLCRA